MSNIVTLYPFGAPSSSRPPRPDDVAGDEELVFTVPAGVAGEVLENPVFPSSGQQNIRPPVGHLLRFLKFW